MKKNIYNFIKRNEKKIASLFMVFVMSSMFISVCYADDPKLITGTVNLFKQVTKWLLLIIPVGAGAFAGWHAFQKSMSDDEAVIAQKNKLIKNTIIGAAIAVTADGLITAILAFYK
ncbi:MAG TPA: hypothetical protein GXX73_14200 [Clostridium sp.]|nr:hypothetical protein [Clostridium sp.]